MAGPTRGPAVKPNGSTAAPPLVIEARALHRTFGRHVALSGIDLDVRQGEIFGLVGADGAGKTTLLQIAAAILDPTSGSCRVLGFDSVKAASSIAGRIGYMSQGFTLYDRLSVGENLRFAARIRGVSGQAWTERREQLLSMAGLLSFVDRRADRLSGGMRKKLALCTNLIHQPRLLLLDEPSLGVDPLSRRELWQMLRRFRDEGATIVLATSYMDEAGYCDQIALLDRGRILALGTPEELRARGTGKVFEVAVTEAGEVESALFIRHDVKAIQRMPSHVRFQIDVDGGLPDDLRAMIERFGPLQSVDPQLDDIFALVADQDADRSAGRVQDRAASLPRRDGPAIRARNITCRFGKFVAVDDVSLEISPGEVFGFLGPNGAGKTTLIRILCGLQAVEAGDIWVAGVDVRSRPLELRQRIGYMSQRFSLYPDLTVDENLAFFAGAYGLSGIPKLDAIGSAIEMASLRGFGDHRTGEVSGAIRQRLALACSLMHRPSVLYLDEPTSGVDPNARHRFWRLIHDLAATGMAIFVTTHYLDEAAYCHRLGLMYRGRLIASGDLDRLRSDLKDEPADTVEDIFMAHIARERRAEAASAAGVGR